MKIKYLIATAVLLSHASVYACEDHPAATQGAELAKDFVIYSDESKAIMVDESRPDFMIKLPSNPTTGFSWFLVDDFNPNLFEVTASEYEPALKNEGVVGAGGYRTFQVHLVSTAFQVPTSAKLHFLYAKSWEVDGNIKEFTIRTFNGN